MRQALTLSQLNGMVADAVTLGVPGEYIVCAELANVREKSGHCYMELVEKDAEQNTPIAKAEAKCWRQTWQRLAPHFIYVTGQPLTIGMKVMLTVRADFHIAYGFAWIVTDISPEYSLGEMARRRQEIVAKLKSEGVFDLQHDLQLPHFCKRIAVVSAEGAAGYGDFVAQLMHNGYGLAFSVTLFAAIMQGERVESSVIAALNQIYQQIDSFDCVVIIRGGGATSDLVGFDTMALAENIANFPLPIITGIGHERDESVADMVACVKVKTPTAAASFLIDNLRQTADFLNNAAIAIQRYATQRMEIERTRLLHISTLLPRQAAAMVQREQMRVDHLQSLLPIYAHSMVASCRTHLDTMNQQMANAAKMCIQREYNRLNVMDKKLPSTASYMIQREKHRIELLSTRLSALDPKLMLRRGYAIVSMDGRTVKDAASLHQGDAIGIRFEVGRAKAEVTAIDTKS